MLLKLNNIKKHFFSPDGTNKMEVLNGISLEIAEGDSIAILGPSGSGKTTLLNIIGGLEKPDSGAVYFKDKNLTQLKERELADIRNREIGFVFQLHHLLPQCSVLENILIPALPGRKKYPLEKAGQRAGQLLMRVGMDNHRDHKPAHLSGGQMQRVAVIRALINSPSLILADEPTGSLDNTTAGSLADLLVKLNSEAKTALVTVTHSRELAERMDKAYILKNGMLEKT